MRPTTSVYIYFVRFPLVASLVLLIVMGIFAKRGLVDWRRIISQSNQLQSKIETLTAEKENLERQMQALQSDPEEQESVVRQVLGYVKPNETVIEFE